MPWFVYALATPALYGITNFIDKFVIDKKIKDPLIATTVGGFVGCIIGILIFAFTGFKFLDLTQTLVLLFAGVLLVIYLIPYFTALKLDDASMVVPLYQVIPIFVLIESSLFLNEVINVRQLFGFLIVIAGGLTLSVERLESGIVKPRKTFWYMMLSSFLYASVLVLVRFVVKTENYWVSLSYEFMGNGIGAFLLLTYIGIKKFKRELKKIVPIAGLWAINSSLAILAIMSETFAISLVPVAFVSIFGGMQPIFLLIYGIILSLFFPQLIKEDIRKKTIGKKLIAILIILFGLYLIYF